MYFSAWLCHVFFCIRNVQKYVRNKKKGEKKNKKTFLICVNQKYNLISIFSFVARQTADEPSVFIIINYALHIRFGENYSYDCSRIFFRAYKNSIFFAIYQLHSLIYIIKSYMTFFIGR